MKIIVTTSDKYLHIIPIFCYLFNKNFNDKLQVEIVGYDGFKSFIKNETNKHTYKIPDNFNFVSLGEQKGSAKNFSTDLRKYFKVQDDWFIWMMEDTFIKDVYFNRLLFLSQFVNNTNEKIGRINLCSQATILQEHFISDIAINSNTILENTQTAKYRLCTQPSIWNKQFLLKYLTTGLTPWEFETQDAFNDDFKIIGMREDVILHNEGVTKWDIYKYNLNGIKEEQISEMKQLGIL